MMKVSCDQLGDTSCHYVAEGENAQEVKEKLMEHGRTMHDMESMPEDEKDKMMMKVDELLAPQM